jgi:hypothetical protein
MLETQKYSIHKQSPGIFFGGWGGGVGGAPHSAEDRGQREGGSGGSSPLVRGFTQFVIERNPYSD